jgi:hypothetical protein
MNKPDHKQEKMPEDVRRELESAPPLTREEREHYSYMKADFMEAIRRASQPAPAGGVRDVIDAVFSLAGRLIEHADAVLAPPPTPVPVPRATKGPAARGREEKIKPVGRAEKKVDGARIVATTLREGWKTEVEVDVIDEADGTEIRPLHIRVCDNEGKEIAEPVDVELTEHAPRWPKPAAGVYVFQVSWEGGSGEMRLEFRKRG